MESWSYSVSVKHWDVTCHAFIITPSTPIVKWQFTVGCKTVRTSNWPFHLYHNFTWHYYHCRHAITVKRWMAGHIMDPYVDTLRVPVLLCVPRGISLGSPNLLSLSCNKSNNESHMRGSCGKGLLANLTHQMNLIQKWLKKVFFLNSGLCCRWYRLSSSLSYL